MNLKNFKINDMKKLIINFSLMMLSVLVFMLLTSFVLKVFISGSEDEVVDRSADRYEIDEVIQVNILNANGIDGIAANTKQFLRSRGFDVVDIGNNKENLNRSMIIDRIGDMASATKLAYSLGINDSLIVSQPDSNMYLKCTVLIGKDYKQLKAFK